LYIVYQREFHYKSIPWCYNCYFLSVGVCKTRNKGRHTLPHQHFVERTRFGRKHEFVSALPPCLCRRDFSFVFHPEFPSFRESAVIACRDSYRGDRRGVERAFLEMTECLSYTIDTPGSPRAAFFAFCPASMLSNAVLLMKSDRGGSWRRGVGTQAARSIEHLRKLV